MPLWSLACVYCAYTVGIWFPAPLKYGSHAKINIHMIMRQQVEGCCGYGVFTADRSILWMEGNIVSGHLLSGINVQVYVCYPCTGCCVQFCVFLLMMKCAASWFWLNAQVRTISRPCDVHVRVIVRTDMMLQGEGSKATLLDNTVCECKANGFMACAQVFCLLSHTLFQIVSSCSWTQCISVKLPEQMCFLPACKSLSAP